MQSTVPDLGTPTNAWYRGPEVSLVWGQARVPPPDQAEDRATDQGIFQLSES